MANAIAAKQKYWENLVLTEASEVTAVTISQALSQAHLRKTQNQVVAYLMVKCWNKDSRDKKNKVFLVGDFG